MLGFCQYCYCMYSVFMKFVAFNLQVLLNCLVCSCRYTHNISCLKCAYMYTHSPQCLIKLNQWVMAWHRKLVTCPLPQRPGFDSRPVLVGFVMDRVTLRQDFLQLLHSSFHYHFTSAPYSFICLQCYIVLVTGSLINPLNAKLNPICHLLALLGGATIVVVSRLRVKQCIYKTLFFQLQMSFSLQSIRSFSVPKRFWKLISVVTKYRI